MDKDPETESAFWVPHSETTNWLTVFFLWSGNFVPVSPPPASMSLKV